MNHLTKEHYIACKHCIDLCESAINEFQKLVSKCITNNEVSCAAEIGKSVNAAIECIHACTICIDECRKHIKTCTESACVARCQLCIDSCELCINECQQTIRECKIGNNQCVPSAEKAIEILSACAQACKECIK